MALQRLTQPPVQQRAAQPRAMQLAAQPLAWRKSSPQPQSRQNHHRQRGSPAQQPLLPLVQRLTQPQVQQGRRRAPPWMKKLAALLLAWKESSPQPQSRQSRRPLQRPPAQRQQAPRLQLLPRVLPQSQQSQQSRRRLRRPPAPARLLAAQSLGQASSV